MYSKDEITKMVFFDIETASQYESLADLNKNNPKMAELWKKRCEYLRTRFEENKEISDDDLYVNKAALHAEFNRIVCVSFGRITYDLDTPSMLMKSYFGKNEKEILIGVHKVFNKFTSAKFVGHSIKKFDVPVLCKRLLLNGFELPKGLQIQNLKPWEQPYIDTAELWSFGSWQEGFISLELLATSLDLDTPKDDIKGEDVTRVFWKEGDCQRIAEYCQKDVLATTQVVMKLSNLEVVEYFELQSA